jgi:hypothetical protein
MTQLDLFPQVVRHLSMSAKSHELFGTSKPVAFNPLPYSYRCISNHSNNFMIGYGFVVRCKDIKRVTIVIYRILRDRTSG